MKICADFSFRSFYFSFYLFIIVYSSLVNLFLITFLTLSQISLYFSSNSSFLIRSDIHLVSSKSLLYTLIFQALSLNFFTTFVLIKMFKTIFTKRNPVTNYYFPNVYIIYRNWDFALVKFVFFNFSIGNKIFLIVKTSFLICWCHDLIINPFVLIDVS